MVGIGSGSGAEIGAEIGVGIVVGLAVDVFFFMLVCWYVGMLVCVLFIFEYGCNQGWIGLLLANYFYLAVFNFNYFEIILKFLINKKYNIMIYGNVEKK